MIRIALLVAFVCGAGAAPALAKDCRTPDAPPGVRVPKPIGCQEPPAPRKPRTAPQLRASPEPGFIDLGNGGQVRIGGRVRVDAVKRR